MGRFKICLAIDKENRVLTLRSAHGFSFGFLQPDLQFLLRDQALFTNRKGNVAKPLHLALGACIIQAEYGYSDEETALQI